MTFIFVYGGGKESFFNQRNVAIASLPTLTEYSIPPQATDNTINQWLSNHYVAINKTVPAKHKLFIFLPATGATPHNYRLIVQQAANLGYHAIGLQYPNSVEVASLCGSSTDANCFEKVRLEILDGVDRSNRVNVNQANSIENRLVKLLLYLHAQHPTEGWLSYLTQQNVIQWSKFIVAGHSQGGGHTAIIAKQHRVARAVMFAAPIDYSGPLQAYAPWQSAPHLTPTEDYYGFVHVDDPESEGVLGVWQLLGMNVYGQSVRIDAQLPPYNQSHELTTAATPARGGNSSEHCSVVVDVYTPKLPNNTPLFKDVWQYLSFS